ncbi:hypothetical protein [Methylobacterium frigidaeris]|uniref:hypothetical protein n=1 Tax=Methylobacterium frigidaeris TaxID=2038277 RepID=UPI001054F82B|nr:hypothetical protein [Methylobacterium frigidaeris]
MAYLALTAALVLALALGAMLGLWRAARRLDDERRTYTVELTCSECGKDFKTEWRFGDKVRCPHCETLFETAWDADEDDNVFGPWLAGKAQAGDPADV